MVCAQDETLYFANYFFKKMVVLVIKILDKSKSYNWFPSVTPHDNATIKI